MKKGLILSTLIIAALLSFTTAADYNCADGSELSTKTRSIEIGGVKSINGVSIGVTDADEAAAIQRIAAELILEAEEVSLSNETNASATTNIEISEEEYTVTLVYGSSNTAKIKIEGSSEELEIGEDATISGLKINLIEVQTTGDALTVNLVLGTERLSLSTDTDTAEILTIGGAEHLIELKSASDTEALIRVADCGNSSIIKIETPEEPEQNLTETNITINQTDENITTNNQTDINITVNTTNNPPADQNITNQTQTPSEFKEIGEPCTSRNECLTGYCNDNQCSQPNFLQQVIIWISRLFSHD